jgi:hypothetical protein
MPRVKMIVLSADSTGIKSAGNEYEVSKEEAKELISGGYAVPVKGYESAITEPEEKEVIKRVNRTRIKKRKS